MRKSCDMVKERQGNQPLETILPIPSSSKNNNNKQLVLSRTKIKSLSLDNNNNGSSSSIKERYKSLICLFVNNNNSFPPSSLDIKHSLTYLLNINCHSIVSEEKERIFVKWY